MNKNNTLVFITLAIAFVLSILVKPYPYSWAVKLLPMILLIIVTWRHIKSIDKSHSSGVVTFFILGLIFSSCGDFALDYKREGWFIYGLGAFFIAHVCYIVSLIPFTKQLTFNKKILFVVTYLSFGLIMFLQLVDGLGELFIPVLAYMIVLLLMAFSTVFSHRSNIWLVTGGVSFVLSDSLIGLNKFNSPILFNHVWVMCSYYFAQYALVKGYLRTLDKA